MLPKIKFPTLAAYMNSSHENILIKNVLSLFVSSVHVLGMNEHLKLYLDESDLEM